MRSVFFAFLVVFLTGCAVEPKVVQLNSQFDEETSVKLLQPGPNSIKGSAVIRQRGGGVVSCAGLRVSLIPVTAYSYERMLNLYGSSDGGYISANRGRIKFDPNPDAYHRNIKTTFCDAQGFFKFSDVANGDFYVVTTITWKVNDYSTEGGALAQRVSVHGGEIKEAVLTVR